VRGRALPGQLQSGDLHLVASIPHGMLLGVADGLGHGPEAAEAASAAIAILRQHLHDGLAELVSHCHAGLRRTRGVVLSLASIDLQTNLMTWLGVGNVEAVLLRAGRGEGCDREFLQLRGGVVGYRIPSLRAVTLPIRHGDMLVFTTDGIRGEFRADCLRGFDPQDGADYVIERYAKDSDDALVLVARYLGLRP
jgi:serine phosphatase RsbU (regulator of sigma subunit)